MPTFCSLACEVHAYAGQLAAEKFGVRGAMAGDVCDVIGLASDALEEQIAFPMADFEEAAEVTLTVPPETRMPERRRS